MNNVNSKAILAKVKRFVEMSLGPGIDAYDATSEDGTGGGRKEEYRRVGMATARAIAKQMGLPEGSYEVSYNRGGIACPGDITLHGESIYISLEQSSLQGVFMYRRCNGRKDYTGEVNQWMHYKELLDLPRACEKLLRIAGGSRPVSPELSAAVAMSAP